MRHSEGAGARVGRVLQRRREQHAGARAHPQRVAVRRQRRHAQARRLVLPDDVVAPCPKYYRL